MQRLIITTKTCMRYKSIIAFLLIALPIFSQKMKTVEGEYTYYAPENVTIEQAKLTAIERAKIQALADEFGNIISQSSTTSMTNLNGESSVKRVNGLRISENLRCKSTTKATCWW